MSDDVCMRFPLSLLCWLDGDCDGVGHRLRCKLHDTALMLAYRLHWTARAGITVKALEAVAAANDEFRARQR